jgi:hypothetical protein
VRFQIPTIDVTPRHKKTHCEFARRPLYLHQVQCAGHEHCSPAQSASFPPWASGQVKEFVLEAPRNARGCHFPLCPGTPRDGFHTAATIHRINAHEDRSQVASAGSQRSLHFSPVLGLSVYGPGSWRLAAEAILIHLSAWKEEIRSSCAAFSAEFAFSMYVISPLFGTRP